MGHSDRRKEEVTVRNSLVVRKRARACASHTILSDVSCQRFMRAWSEKGRWFGEGKVKRQTGASFHLGKQRGLAQQWQGADLAAVGRVPLGMLPRGTQTLQPQGGDFPLLPILHLYLSLNCVHFSSAGSFLWGQISLSSSRCTWEHQQMLLCHRLILGYPEAEASAV